VLELNAIGAFELAEGVGEFEGEEVLLRGVGVLGKHFGGGLVDSVALDLHQ
jgi:hypothetical protein